MRLLKLRLKNITSFKGEHIIDFAELGGEELFAITGVTGSGKSSILTAISLALYGKNYKKTLYSNDFVSLGESEALAELSFISKNTEYLASWEIRLTKKDGTELKSPTPKRYIKKDNVLIEETAEDIINLSFEQFIKTVILNQGEFSRFLTSSFSERRTILERLHSGDKLSDLGRLLSLQIKELTSELGKTHSIISETTLYSDEVIKETEQRLNDLTTQQDTISNILDKLKLGKDIIVDLKNNFSKHFEVLSYQNEKEQSLQASLSELNFYNKTLSEKKTAFDHSKLILSSEGAKLREAIKLDLEVKNTRSSIDMLQKRKNDIQLDQSKKQARITSIKEKLELNSKSLEALTNQYSELFTPGFDIDLIGEFLKNKQKAEHELAILSNSNSTHIKREETLNKNIQENKTKLANQRESLKKFTNEYNDLKIDESINKLNNLKKELTILENNEDSVKNIKIKVQKINDDINNSKTKYHSLREEISTLAKSIEVITKEEQKSELLHAKLKCIEASNQEGQCIICHTEIEQPLQTPIIENNDTCDKDKLVKELKLKENEFIRTEETQNSLRSQLEALNKDHDTLSIDNEEKDYLLTQIQDLEDKLNSSKTINNNIISLKESLEHLGNTHDSLLEEQEKLQSIIENNHSLITSKNDEINEIKEKVIANFSRYDLPIEEAIKKQSKDKDIIHSSHNLKKENSIFSDEIAQITSDMTNLKKQDEQTQEKSNELKLNLDNQKEKRLHLTKVENPDDELKALQNKVDSAEADFHKAGREQREKERAKDQLEEKVKSIKSDLNNLEMTRITLLCDLKEIKYPNKKKGLSNSLQIRYKNITDAHNKLQKLPKDKITDKDLEILKTFADELLLPFYEEIQGLFNQNNEELIEKKFIIETQAKQELNIAKHKEKAKELKKELTAKENLYNVIGTSGFRNFVNSYIENNLIIFANYELKMLYDGRYEIQSVRANKGNDFYIIDHFNGAKTRKVQTLSGGEIFLVSLAMALSLSEMTRGQAEIESFFIDEGFGTLDSDSIEEALEVLQKISSRGKQVGIISHIKDLTEKIAVNISMEKSSRGESSVKVIFN